MKRWLSGLLATVLLALTMVAASVTSASALQTITHTFTGVNCVAQFGTQTLNQVMDVTLAVIAPDSVTPGQTFTLTFPGGSAGLPTRSNNLAISQYSNLFQTVQLNGANFNSASIVNPGTAGVVPASSSATVWSASTTYAAGDWVIRNLDTSVPPAPPVPNWHFYQSVAGANLNHDPATSPAQWTETTQLATSEWKSTISYAAKAFTVSSGVYYKSLVAANLNHPPATSPTFWSVVPLTTPESVTTPVANQLKYGQPGPFDSGNSSDAFSATLTTPDISVSATAPASGNITLNMTALTTQVTLNGVIPAPVTCAIPNDIVLTIPVVSGPSNLTVNAGSDVSGGVNTPISLGGSFVDPDTTPTLAWSINSASCSFSDATIAAPTVTCSQAGTFTATLNGTDGINTPASDTATVTVTGANVPPVVNAGGNVSGFVSDDIDLNGTVVDPDSDPNIQWTVDSPNCLFGDASSADTVINCDTPGTYAATLTASDGVNAPVTDTAIVTISAAPPGLHANAGPNVTGNVGAAITLAGSITDPGFTPTAHWTVDSPTCSFANANTASTSITCTSSGVFAATLTGHDGTHADSVDTALVKVTAPNTPPNVNAGPNVIGKPTIAIALHGTVVDPDNTPTIHWASDTPNCTFGNANLADTTITCTTTGVFAATLTASDSVNPPVSSTAIVRIVTNFPPIVSAGGNTSGASNAAIALHGTVTDSDSSPTVHWTTGSPSCTFGNANVADTTITCTAGGVVAATLTADDGVNPPVSDSALVTVNAPNTAPTVNAGGDKTETVGHASTLVGTVTDPDSTPAVQWSTGSPSCSFGTPTATTSTFTCSLPGIYAATLTASDGVNPPVSDTALVTFIPGQCTKPCIQIGDATSYEGGVVSLPIVLSSPQSSAVTVTATIIPVTAGNCRVTPLNCDFKTTAVHTIKFAANNRFKYLSVTALPDSIPEGGDHTFQVVLSGVSGGSGVTIGRGVGTGTIKDASGVGPNKVLVGRSIVPEMDTCSPVCKTTAKLSIVLSSAPSTDVSMHYQTASSGPAAVAGTDYLTKNATLTFKAGGPIKKFISVVLLGDNDPEGTGSIDVQLSNLTAGWTFVDAPGNIQILDND